MTDSITTKVKYLIEMGCGEVHHSGGTLIQHLVAVHDILVANEAPNIFVMLDYFIQSMEQCHLSIKPQKIVM